MFAPLKRILILATLLVFPGMAMAYTTVDDIIVADPVQWNATTVPVTIRATVHTMDWKSTYIDWQSMGTPYNICINHADVAGKTTGSTEAEIQEILMLDGEVFNSSNDWFYVRTYDDDTCGNSGGDETTYGSPQDYVEAIDFEVDSGAVELTNFIVTKEFTGHDVLDTVDISIVCNDGHVHPDTAPIGDNGVHNFVVENLHPSNENVHCTVTETSQVAGFETYYVQDDDDNSDYNQTGCVWSGNGNLSVPSDDDSSSGRTPLNSCHIYNKPLPATFTVTKKWEVFNDADLDGKGEGTVRQRVRIGIDCNGPFLKGSMISDDNGTRPLFGLKPGKIDLFESDVIKMGPPGFVLEGDGYIAVEVGTWEGNAECRAWESFRNSAVEKTEDSCADVTGEPKEFEMGPGGSATCGFVNTVFFEGIPTLSQYGMAIMALLMLGLGFVGFRRFV